MKTNQEPQNLAQTSIKAKAALETPQAAKEMAKPHTLEKIIPEASVP